MGTLLYVFYKCYILIKCSSVKSTFLRLAQPSCNISDSASPPVPYPNAANHFNHSPLFAICRFQNRDHILQLQQPQGPSQQRPRRTPASASIHQRGTTSSICPASRSSRFFLSSDGWETEALMPPCHEIRNDTRSFVPL